MSIFIGCQFTKKDLEANGGQIRTPQIKLHVQHHSPENSIFIGSWLANGIPRNSSPDSSFPHETDLIESLFPFLKERVLQTENVCVLVCPSNQKAAFFNKRGNVDLRWETDWG